MRYFVIMNDHIIKQATNVAKCENTGKVYFDVDDKMYRYLTLTCDCEHYMIKRITVPLYSFQQFVNEDWFYTTQIKYLLALDEKENEELNYFQSTDFNAGMLYSAVEKDAVKMLKDRGVLSHSSNYSIPNIQLIPNCCEACNEGNTIDATIRTTTEHFKAVYGKSLELDIYGWQRNKVYCVFFYRITRKEPCKEMTIAEIEEALGYKIKVVGEK
jgi:hypothetical protein